MTTLRAYLRFDREWAREIASEIIERSYVDEDEDGKYFVKHHKSLFVWLCEESDEWELSEYEDEHEDDDGWEWVLEYDAEDDKTVNELIEEMSHSPKEWYD